MESLFSGRGPTIVGCLTELRNHFLVFFNIHSFGNYLIDLVNYNLIKHKIRSYSYRLIMVYELCLLKKFCEKDSKNATLKVDIHLATLG